MANYPEISIQLDTDLDDLDMAEKVFDKVAEFLHKLGEEMGFDPIVVFAGNPSAEVKAGMKVDTIE